MSNVIEFKPSEETHAQGPCICLGCRHEWIGVWPVGVTVFECPKCGLEKGTPHGLMQFGNEEQLIRVCDCGNEFFLLTPEGHMCAKCGTYQAYD